MFNPLGFISKFIKSGNQKELDRIAKIVEKINTLEGNFQNLDDQDFPKKTNELKNKVKNGETLNQILPEAYGGGSKNSLYGQWPPYSFKNWINGVE